MMIYIMIIKTVEMDQFSLSSMYRHVATIKHHWVICISKQRPRRTGCGEGVPSIL